MNRILPLTLLAAFAAPLLLVPTGADAIDIKITNKDAPAIPCRLHMGTEPGDALQLDPNGAPGDLMVRGTFSPGDPCLSGTGLPPPTGTVSLPPGVVPIGGVPFDVNWTAQNAEACTFEGTGWSGPACGGTQACSAGTKQVTLSQGTYDFDLSCTNGVDPPVLVAQETFTVAPPTTESCGYGIGSSTRQLTGQVAFPTSTTTYTNQPFLEWGSLFAIVPQCAPGEESCPDWGAFPDIENGRYFVTVNTSQYISLPFTTENLPADDQGGLIMNVQDSGATPNTRVQYSISDRCGDFDAVGSPWLSANPACMDILSQKTPFAWTTAVSTWTCSLRKNGQIAPNQTWYLNMRVTRCNGHEGGSMPSQCTLYLFNGD